MNKKIFGIKIKNTVQFFYDKTVLVIKFNDIKFCNRWHDYIQNSVVNQTVVNLSADKNSSGSVGKIRHALCVQQPKRRRVYTYGANKERQNRKNGHFNEQSATEF